MGDRDASARDDSESCIAWLTQRLNDPADAVRIMAARRLYNHAESRDTVLDVLADLLKSDSEFVRHAALLTVDELPGSAGDLDDDIRAMQLSNNYLERVAEHALNSR